MTHTKKRILAMLLAVVLCFSALPFSVSADELPGELSTESTVEIQPEETPAEDSTPSEGETAESSPSENRSITISDSSGDVPVLYAQDPFNTVKSQVSQVEGGTNYMTSVGVTRESIVRELEAHEDDNYYLGTPYAGGDAQSPNGDASYNSGTVGMNCAGFISYVLRKAGLDAETTMEITCLTIGWQGPPTTKTSSKTAISAPTLSAPSRSCFPVAWPRKATSS